MKTHKQLEEDMKREKLFRYFVDKYYSGAREEVIKEMMKEVKGKAWKLTLSGEEQTKRISERLGKWFKEIEETKE